MPTQTFNRFFISELHRLLGQEKRIATILPRLEEAAEAPLLRTTFANCAREARTAQTRLEDVFSGIGKKPITKTCPRVEGLVEECEKIAKLKADPRVRDVALIAAAQHFTHDQIAGYGCARTWATLLDLGREANLLQQTLDEKKLMDTQFTRLAERINKDAVALTTA
jgi:ferritin-like metal-binding protein YciE